ncbi:GH92 family glycosyl hydrolase [Sphaerisporangium viridialbum]|uniref:GH92 family glycosyl hydrolase n=1 Tax=Sphaerisporangium viridialbum TaxID=46189 RepID=UPI003C77B5B1
MSIWSLPIVAAVLAATAFPGGAVVQSTPDEDPAALVNTFLGTKEGGPDFGHGGGAGMNFPGAVLPFGMMQWSPDTVANAGGGYKWEDNRLRGFSMTHISGPGCTGAQDFPVMPISGTIGRSPATHGDDYVPTFKHENEKSSPGFYGTTLDTGVKAELSVSTRAGVGRFTFPPGKPGTLLLNTSGSVNGIDDGETRITGNTVEGWVQTGGFCGPPMRYRVYFSATFDQPVTGSGTWKDDAVLPGVQTVRNASKAKVTGETVTAQDVVVNGPGSGAYLQFDSARPVQMRVGLSYVSVDGARNNVRTEIGTDGLDQVAQKARATWSKRLGQVRVTGGTLDQRRTFYSNLYHSLLQPYVAEDADGTYTGMDNKPHKVAAGRHHYATFSGWDIYRSEVQLLALLAPDVGSDIAQSMYDNAQSIGNVWDRWSHQSAVTGVMVGDPFHSIISSMYAFGARGYDAPTVLKAMVAAAKRVGPMDIGHPQAKYDERPGNAAYMTKGYVPADPSSTLEYGIADFGLAQLASRLGDATTSGEFMKRSQAWQNIYNPANSWIQPRMAEGSFTSPFDPASPDVYIEGNGAQYHWLVPHNPRGLFDVMGGNAKAVGRLDGYFKKLNAGPREPYAYMGNEPAMPAPWLYAWAGQPYKTQDLVRRVQQELFTPGPDGLAGNDDLGAMGSWYVWSAMGIFPAIPGRAELLVNTPLFDKITITRDKGSIEINAPGSAARYVQTLKVNGVRTTKAWLPESFATGGGRLDFTLGTTPNTTFGAGVNDVPPSFNDGAKQYVIGADPGSGPVEPGGTFEALFAAQSATKAVSLKWEAKPPAGITVSPASGTLVVPAGGRATVKLSITVGAGVGVGFQTVPISATEPTSSGSVSTAQTTGVRLNVAKRGTIDWYMNNAGIGDEAEPGQANLDGTGFGYPAQALAGAGLRPGGKVDWKGFQFTWPNRRLGEWDNLVTGNQAIEMAAPDGATKLAFLGSGTNTAPLVDTTITYTDGSTSTAKLGFSDWMLNYGGSPPSYGNEIVAQAPYRLYSGSWQIQPLSTFVFAAQPIALTAGKKVKSVKFSPVEGGSLHLFAWAFS